MKGNASTQSSELKTVGKALQGRFRFSQVRESSAAKQTGAHSAHGLQSVSWRLLEKLLWL